MPAPCTACRSADSSPRNFLLTCIQCSRPWHHRCHRPVITDKELVNIIKLFNARGPNVSGPKRLEWTCAACLKGKGAAAGGSGLTSIERPRAISTNERAGSASGSGGASGSSLNVTRPQQAPAKSNTTTRPPAQARKQASVISIDDDDDEIQIIENPLAAAPSTGPSTTPAPAAQPPHSQPQPKALPQPQAPVPKQTLPRPPLPTNSVKSAAAAQPPRPPAPSIARPKTTAAVGPSTTTAPPSASHNAILPSSTPTHPGRQLAGTFASASATVDPLPKPAPGPVPQAQPPAQPSAPQPQSARPQHAAKSASSRPQAAKKTVNTKAPVPAQPTPPPTSKPTPGPSTAAHPPGSRAGAGVRVIDDPVSFPLSTGPASASSARPMAAPTGAAAAHSPAPPPSARGRFHPIITVHRGADESDEEEEEEELDVDGDEDEFDVDEDGDDEDMRARGRSGARTALRVSESKAGLAAAVRDNARAPPAPGRSASVTLPRRLPEWINARAEASDKAPAQDMWARAAVRLSAPTRSDTNATQTAPGDLPLPLTSRRARKAFRVVHRPAGRPAPVGHGEDGGKGKGKGREKERLVPAATRNSNSMLAAPFFFTADAWTVQRMAELGV